MWCLICGADHVSCGQQTPMPIPPLDFRWERNDMPMKPSYVSPERLYLDGAGRVVRGKDPTRVTLLVAEGGTLPHEVAIRYGLLGAEPVSIPSPSVPQVTAPAPTPLITSPSPASSVITLSDVVADAPPSSATIILNESEAASELNVAVGETVTVGDRLGGTPEAPKRRGRPPKYSTGENL